MDFAIILAVTIVGCFALRNPLKALPVAFYAAAIAIDVVYVYGVFFGLPRAIWSPLFVLIQKCELSLALFVVVMFIGCLNRDGRAYPDRRVWELSRQYKLTWLINSDAHEVAHLCDEAGVGGTEAFARELGIPVTEWFDW